MTEQRKLILFISFECHKNVNNLEGECQMTRRWVIWGDAVERFSWFQSIFCQGQYYYAVRMPGPWTVQIVQYCCTVQPQLIHSHYSYKLLLSKSVTQRPEEEIDNTLKLWSYFSKEYQKDTVKAAFYQLTIVWRKNSLKCGGQTDNVVCLASLVNTMWTGGDRKVPALILVHRRSHIRQAGQDSWIPPGHRRLVYGVSLKFELFSLSDHPYRV